MVVARSKSNIAKTELREGTTMLTGLVAHPSLGKPDFRLASHGICCCRLSYKDFNFRHITYHCQCDGCHGT